MNFKEVKIVSKEHLRVSFHSMFDADKREMVKTPNLTIKEVEAFYKHLTK